MKITSVGSFKLEEQAITVEDPNVTDTAIILTTFQSYAGSRWHSLNGFVGIKSRVPGISFDFEAHHSGGGSIVGYLILEP